jgi:hypothetical protein
MMISLACLAHQEWILMQHEWSKWSGKTDKSQFQIFSLCWSWPSELYINAVHNKLRYCNVCALCIPRCLKEDSKNLCFETTLSHFQWFKEERNEFLESTATGVGHLCSIWHLKQTTLEWCGNIQHHWQQHVEIFWTRPGHLLRGLILWYENATPHSIHQTQELLQSRHWELLASSTLHTVLDLPDQTVICLGCWSNTQVVTNSTIMREWKRLFVNCCK